MQLYSVAIKSSEMRQRVTQSPKIINCHDKLKSPASPEFLNNVPYRQNTFNFHK